MRQTITADGSGRTDAESSYSAPFGVGVLTEERRELRGTPPSATSRTGRGPAPASVFAMIIDNESSNAPASLAALFNVMFLAPLSMSVIYVRCKPDLAASSSWDNPSSCLRSFTTEPKLERRFLSLILSIFRTQVAEKGSDLPQTLSDKNTPSRDPGIRSVCRSLVHPFKSIQKPRTR